MASIRLIVRTHGRIFLNIIRTDEVLTISCAIDKAILRHLWIVAYLPLLHYVVSHVIDGFLELGALTFEIMPVSVLAGGSLRWLQFRDVRTPRLLMGRSYLVHLLSLKLGVYFVPDCIVVETLI